LVDKGIAKSLEPFIEAEADFAKDGYHVGISPETGFSRH